VPIGSNPWRGPPVPLGTPVEDPRMSLPMNKFPFIPPQIDPDPGPPSVQLPPGVPPGPGPAPHAPFPLPYPPNTPAVPPPLPFYGPPDHVVPPYGRTPPAPAAPPAAPPPPPPAAPIPPPPPPGNSLNGTPLPAEAPLASGPMMTSYDSKTGVFVDPAGGTGVFAPGAEKLAPAENWADLMMAPRQM
jgi:phospholipid/cholesterol/gamma-HCH transport system substrate-binding protein